MRLSNLPLAVWLLVLVLLAAAPAAIGQPVPGPAETADTTGDSNDEAERASLRETDRVLRERLSARMAVIPGLEKARVEVTGGVVRLTGEAAGDGRRQLAATIAEQAEGVVHVDNQLTIDTAVATRTAPVVEHARLKLLSLVASIPLLLLAALIVYAAWWGGGWLSKRKSLTRARRNPFLTTLTRQGVHLAVVLVGLVIALDLLEATALVGALLGTAGIIGIAIGFAFRDVAENYIAGILLSLRQPFSPHDHVVIDGHEGKVAALTSRATILITLDGNHLRLPNALVFKGVMLNYSRNPTRRMSFDVGIANEASISHAQKVALAAMGSMDALLKDPAPSVIVLNLGDSSTILRAGAWVDQRSASFGLARSEAIRLVKRAFATAGIDMPDPGYRVELRHPPPEELPTPSSRPSRPTSKAVGSPPAGTLPEESIDEADTRPDAEIDRQVDIERVELAETNLLDPNGKRE